jgi:hypothetical protein
MGDKIFQNEGLDPRLEQMLETLRHTPQRNPRAVEAGKARYLAELEKLELPKKQSLAIDLNDWNSRFKGLKETLGISFRKPLKATAIILIMILILLFSGAGATAYAAQSALPGDALYAIKTGIEDTRIHLAADAAFKTELYLGFAEKRLDEIAQLIGEKRYDDITLATKDFDQNIQQALATFQIAAQGDPQRAVALATKITNALTRYASILNGMLVQVPEAVRPELEQAISVSENKGSLDKPGGNDNNIYKENINTNNNNYGDNCTLGSITVDALEVPENTTCTLNGTKVKGNILVYGNATLIAYDVWVGGNIQADHSARVEVHPGSYIGGNIQVDYSGLLLVSSVRIDGNLQAFNNSGSQSYTGNMIGGDLQAFDNHGGVSIQNNTIDGNLQCKSNAPAPTGSGNHVNGNMEDQCAIGFGNSNDNDNNNGNGNNNDNDDDDNVNDDDDNVNDNDDDDNVNDNDDDDNVNDNDDDDNVNDNDDDDNVNDNDDDDNVNDNDDDDNVNDNDDDDNMNNKDDDDDGDDDDGDDDDD